MNIETKIKEEAIYWIACENEGLNELEKQEFKHWLESNQEHQSNKNIHHFLLSIIFRMPRIYSAAASFP